MMLGNPEISGQRRENDGGFSSSAAFVERASEGNGGGGGGEGAEGSSSAAVAASGGNRWPQEETSALLKIRLEMDSAFRDSGIKAPLWDEVSRRMAEIGYHRSAKKCKEKFENLYKYHKRTKKDQLVRSNGKIYRFFDQLEALDHHEVSPTSPAPEQIIATNAVTMTATPLFRTPLDANPGQQILMPTSFQNLSSNIFPAPMSTTSSSGEEYGGNWRRKRKWEDFFGRIMKVVLEKQEDLHKKFLEALDKCERERVAREEAWKTREMDRIKREQELLERERAIAAAKDAAVIAFLQKVSEQGKSFPEQGKNSVEMPENPSAEEKSIGDKGNGNNNDNQWETSGHSGSSRWPKEEVEALIKIRANMELDNQGNAAKGPLWEEISASMKKLGYDRNAKRCKEKWENINKYFRRVKESNKKRTVDSKTCPYFQQLEALYSIKSQKADNNSDVNLRPEELLMHMMNHHREQEDQQHPAPQEQHVSMVDQEASENVNQTQEDHGDEDEDYEEGEYQIVANVASSRLIVD